MGRRWPTTTRHRPASSSRLAFREQRGEAVQVLGPAAAGLAGITFFLRVGKTNTFLTQWSKRQIESCPLQVGCARISVATAVSVATALYMAIPVDLRGQFRLQRGPIAYRGHPGRNVFGSPDRKSTRLNS